MAKLSTATSSRWFFTHLANLRGPTWRGGGIPLFLFTTEEAEFGTAVAFVGGGGGPGESLLGVDLEKALASILEPRSRDAWTPLDLKRDFSLCDLHNCLGTLTQVSANFMAGFGVLAATAANRRGPVFSAGVLGGGLGVGLIATSTVGFWCVLSDAVTSLNPAGQQLAPRVNHYRQVYPDRPV